MLGLTRRTDCVVSDGKGLKPILTKGGALVFRGKHGEETADMGMDRLYKAGRLLSAKNDPEAREIPQNIENLLRLTRGISWQNK